MKKHLLNVLFFLKKGRVTKNGKSPVIMRIILNGVRTEMSINRKVAAKLWNQAKERATGKDKESVELNMYIESLRTRIYKIQRDLEDSSTFYNVRTIKDHLEGKHIQPPKMFFELFQENNERYEKLAGIDVTTTTWKRYVRCLNYFKEMYIPITEHSSS